MTAGPVADRVAQPVGPPPVPRSDPLAECLATALEAAEAADRLGLDTAALRAAHGAGTRRLGFPGEAYVLALIGGTGVGKSSLLNALAGGEVSQASARRPTTAHPVAWIPRTERDVLAPLLDWLAVAETREHDVTDLGPVAILDLPDTDSVAAEHRTRVEALLPLVDAVAWVADPEKYGDAVLHDELLRAWLPRLDRQVLLINKTDRLTPADARRVQRDLEATVASGVIRGSEVPVLATSAAIPGGVEDLRAWIADGAESKRLVRGRIAASLAASVRDLAWSVAEGRPSADLPLLGEDERAAAIRSSTEAIFRVVDLGGLERQAVAATQAVARPRGAGPLGRVTSFFYRTSGRQTAVADPKRHLRRWRERGGLGPAVEAVRSVIARPLRDAPPALRPALAATLEPARIRVGLERSLDQAIGGLGDLEPPTSRWWPFLGALQTLATLAIALSAAWVVLWVLARPPTASIELPVLGPVPSPFVALVASLAAGYLLARWLGLHARWLGRRWAARVRGRVAEAIDREVRQRAFAPVDDLEDALRRLRAADARIDERCVRSALR